MQQLIETERGRLAPRYLYKWGVAYSNAFIANAEALESSDEAPRRRESPKVRFTEVHEEEPGLDKEYKRRCEHPSHLSCVSLLILVGAVWTHPSKYHHLLHLLNPEV